MKTVYILDRNSFALNTDEEVGYSIVTLTEETKCRSKHDRNKEYKKILSLWDKPNWHIYFPMELKEYESNLLFYRRKKDVLNQCKILELMCNDMFILMCEYFYLLICLVVIVLLHKNHNLVVKSGNVYPRDEHEAKLANFANEIIHKFAFISKNKDIIFKDGYYKWSKDKCNSNGNEFFNSLVKEYLAIIGKKVEKDYILCGKNKNINLLIFDKTKNVTKYDVEEIFNNYFNFKLNDSITKNLFIPYIVDVFNANHNIFEFNHIADAFLVFNAFSASKYEDINIEIKSKDSTLNKLYELLCN